LGRLFLLSRNQSAIDALTQTGSRPFALTAMRRLWALMPP
jgi:hypothetical protein